jgi:uncharacterized protein involved in type VI secretion and phage assembly
VINPDQPDFDPTFFGIHEGVVVDRNDPLKLGRVRFRIPGLIEPKSSWALPIGSPGGGTKDAGLWWIPRIGSEVAVWFKGGDPDHPRYMPANWGTGEPPTASQGNPDIVVLGLGSYDIVIDTREGQKNLKIVDKDDPENSIEFDGVTKAIQLSATTAIKIVSTGQVDIQGLLVTINGQAAGLGKL